ncbi:hypothetical protein ACHHYP_08948 [Achlya hypogyna]|uniref:Uncharacterized protein n=1 Tax=Achlya hypogyna TaxID=1202772 RepID=A0A1V9ZJW3_ACHHY|nr:hypothetical protein ACHHYP_08948 [Achlya hypogyna]
MSVQATSYDGPVLADVADFRHWAPEFLDTVAGLHLAEYYTVADDEGEPRAHTALARRMLFLALDAPLRAHVRGAGSPFNMWRALSDMAAKRGAQEIAGLLHLVLRVKYSPLEPLKDFFSRLETATDAFTDVLLPVVDDGYAATIAERLRTTFLCHALELQSPWQFAQWDLGASTWSYKSLKQQLEAKLQRAPSRGSGGIDGEFDARSRDLYQFGSDWYRRDSGETQRPL